MGLDAMLRGNMKEYYDYEVHLALNSAQLFTDYIILDKLLIFFYFLPFHVHNISNKCLYYKILLELNEMFQMFHKC